VKRAVNVEEEEQAEGEEEFQTSTDRKGKVYTLVKTTRPIVSTRFFCASLCLPFLKSTLTISAFSPPFHPSCTLLASFPLISACPS
jgi:hypothetical protein